jgi:CHAT domain-containing protein/Tfp pilus assembly protein PilF
MSLILSVCWLLVSAPAFTPGAPSAYQDQPRTSQAPAQEMDDRCDALFQLGEYQQALECYDQVLRLKRAAGDRAGEAATLTAIGVVYTNFGERQRALEYYQQALPIARASGDRRVEATTLIRIGWIYWVWGQSRRALENYNQALALQQAAGDRAGEALALGHIGVLYGSLGENQQSLEYYQRALALRRSVGDRALEAAALNNVGTAYESLGQPQQALEYYAQAQRLWGPRRDPRFEMGALFGMARAERDLGHFSEARRRIEAALDMIESLGTKVTSPDLRTSYRATMQRYYQFHIDLLMQMHQRDPSAGHDAAALQASERARARRLVELLAETKVDVQQGIAPELKYRERAAEARLSTIQRQLITAHSQTKPDLRKLAALEEELKQVDIERERLEMDIRQKHPRYADLQYPTPLGLKKIQGLLDEQTALLEYALGGDSSFLFVITTNDFLVARLPSAESVSDRVIALRETIATTPRRTARREYLAHARRLFQELIQPAGRLLAGKRGLIIVPDGVLHYLPFEVLLRSGDVSALLPTEPSRWPYLVRDYSISYVPSAGVLASLRDPGQEGSGRRKTFLACADPVYGTNPPQETSPLRAALPSAFGESKSWKLERLQQSRREVTQIAKLYAKDEVALLVGAQANEENVKAEGRLSHYRFIHFAAHGLLNETKPQYSGLILSLPHSQENPKSEIRNPKSVEDGLLQVYEIFNLKLNADLVVLSACETGLGKQVKGEGLVGLTRAFLYAGTPSVVVSLWKVLDTSTAGLMVRFYSHLKNGKRSKADALRQAKLEMIHQGQFAHPFYWAPFILVGDGT